MSIKPIQFDWLARQRRERPESFSEALAHRQKRPLYAKDTPRQLFIIAADHPARGALGVGSNPLAMADRYDLLSRLALALECDRVDGILGTADILEDLALLGLLENKLAVGSLNRGGLAGSVFELDDRYTAYDPVGAVRDRLDFLKLLIRLNLQDPATLQTLEATARVVSESAKYGLPIMLEPFVTYWESGKLCYDLGAEAVIRSVAICAGLGNTSRYSWLKLPIVPRRMQEVARASTLPILVLGGDSGLAQAELLSLWGEALAVKGVEGMVVGRSLLYPKDGRVLQAVKQTARLFLG